MIPPMKRRKDQFRLDHQDRKRDEEKGSDVVFKFRAAVNLDTSLKHAALAYADSVSVAVRANTAACASEMGNECHFSTLVAHLKR